MTAAPVQRVGLHELTQLLDGDVTCSKDDSPATHAIFHGSCVMPACDEHTAGFREWLAAARCISSARLNHDHCGARDVDAASITIRPI